MVYGAELPACSPSSAIDIVVESAEDLAGLVEQTNCSDGEFIVSWRGGVVFDYPIVVGNFTSLSIVGVGYGAVLDGGGATRLFEVSEMRMGIICLTTPYGITWLYYHFYDNWTLTSTLTSTCLMKNAALGENALAIRALRLKLISIRGVINKRYPDHVASGH